MLANQIFEHKRIWVTGHGRQSGKSQHADRKYHDHTAQKEEYLVRMEQRYAKNIQNVSMTDVQNVASLNDKK